MNKMKNKMMTLFNRMKPTKRELYIAIVTHAAVSIDKPR